MSRSHSAQLLGSITREVRTFIANVILFNERTAEQLGLNVTDLQCLNLLDLAGSATPGQLAKWCARTTGGITVVLDRLEEAGYVKREDNPKDRRSSIIRPVPGARKNLMAIYRANSELLLHVLSGYDQHQLKLILDFFEKTNRGAAERDRERTSRRSRVAR